MRTLRVFESISVDGYFTDAHGDMSWAHAIAPDREFEDWVGNNASQNGELLFGRKTYEQMAAFWPTPLAAERMPVIAKGINAAKKYVASRTLVPTWNNTTALRDLVADVRALKATSGPGLVVLSSGSIAAQLGDAGLVDEYQFVIVPIVLGAGRTVVSTKRKLALLDQRVFKNGNVVTTYAAA